MPARILVVDDEEVVCRAVARILDGKGHAVETVTDGTEGLRRVEAGAYDLVILDIMMPDVSGLDILQRVKETHPDTDVIMITGLSQIETAVQSMKLGAFDYIPKPFTPEELVDLGRALARAPAPAAREHAPARRGRLEVPLREHHRLLAADAERLPAHRQVRPDQQHGLHQRRERHRQGADRAGDPLQQPAQGPAVRPRGLRQPQRDAARERAVRAHQGRLHRRGDEQAGAVQGRRRRHALPRRDRQHLARDPGQAAARAAGARVQAGRRHAHAVLEHPADHRDEPRPQGARRARAGSARTCSTGSTSSRSRCRRCASGARTSRRSPTTSSRPSATSWASGCATSPPTRSTC